MSNKHSNTLNMKYFYYCLLVIFLGCYWACSEDKVTFDVMASEEEIRFDARPGGAMMYYSLPGDRDVFAMICRYTDCRGQEILKRAGYGSDSLMLDGFNEAEKGVPVSLSLVDRNGNESEAIQMTFDTEESAPYAFFNNATVESGWDGFQLRYTAPDEVSGMYHVFYVGTNPLTGEPDTIPLKSEAIVAGGDTILFALQQERPENTVVIRTEDHRGFRVKQEVWQGIEVFHPEKLGASQLDFIDPRNLVFPSASDKCGIEYLFDGDLKGEQRMMGGQQYELYTFVAGPQAVGAPFIIDMQSEYVPAKVRIYCMLRNRLQFPGIDYWTKEPNSETGEIWQSKYDTKIPCEVTVYGGDSEDPDGEWVELGHFEEDHAAAYNSYNSTERRVSEDICWAARCIDAKLMVSSYEELEAADPAYLELVFPVLPAKYRYLKLVVNDLFDNYLGTAAGDQNYAGYVTMHELEIYVKPE